jgi:hypothetical protein
MITEALIEKVLDQLEQSDFEAEFNTFKSNFPIVFSYLANDQLQALTEEEYQIMLFNAMVIARSFELSGTLKSDRNPELLEHKESANWNLLKNSKPVGFNEKLDVFFEHSSQEDLLAFIEDSLIEDDDFQISSAAREIIFISLKSIVDFLEENQ